MALADSNEAIGAVTQLLMDHIVRQTGLNITATHPRSAANTNTNPKLNLFLFETSFDPALKNVSLSPNEPAPLWLVLRYALTAYDTGGGSDTVEAHQLIGRGMAALHEVNFLRLHSNLLPPVLRALENNPELLKLTFDETSVDTISKLMQGPDETYRFSIIFQVRPVMIVPGVPPSYSQLVGVDYRTSPPAIIGRDGVQIAVLPSLGPTLDSLEPDSFEASLSDATAPVATIHGNDLHLSNLECLLGSVQVPIISQRPDRLQIRIGSTVAAGAGIAAGEHPLVVRQLLPNGRYRSSNMLTARLRPTLTSVSTAGIALNAGTPPTVTGSLALTGLLLGRDIDDVRVAFAVNGNIVRSFDVLAPATGDQTTLTVPLPAPPSTLIQQGVYRLFLVINGVQAINSPTVSLQ